MNRKRKTKITEKHTPTNNIDLNVTVTIARVNWAAIVIEIFKCTSCGSTYRARSKSLYYTEQAPPHSEM